jgi:hypothetical protein
MPRVASRYAQVALTYTRPWYMRLWAAFIAWFVLASIVFQRKADYGGQIAYLLIGGTIAAWGGAIIAGHMKEQLADARARLTPGFRKPHLIVALLVFVAGVIGFGTFVVAQVHRIPVIEGWPTFRGLTYSGYFAIVLLSAAGMAWSTHLQSAAFIFSTIGAGLLLVTTPGARVMSDMFVGRSPAVAYGVIAASVAALAGLAWRLAVMNEEMAEYWRMEGARWGLRPQMTGDPRQRRNAFAEAGPINEFLRRAARLEFVPNVFAAGFWMRVRHWRIVAGVGRLSWLGGGMFLAFLFVIHFVGIKPSKDEQLAVLIFIPAMLSLVMPAIFTMTTWAQRWNMLAVESLRPVASRGRFLREQGTALALDLAIMWAAITAGTFATALFYQPRWLLSGTVAAILFRSAAAQMWIFALNVWMLRYRTQRWLGFVAFVGSMLLVAVLTGKAIDGTKGTLNTPSPLVSLLFVLVSVVITYDAYRRWLRTDLD